MPRKKKEAETQQEKKHEKKPNIYGFDHVRKQAAFTPGKYGVKM